VLLALWLVAALIAAGIAAAALWPRTGPRDDVNAYVDRVNATAKTFSGDYRTIEDAFRTFSFAPADAQRQLPQVRTASAELTRLRESIAAVPAPEPAAELRRRLIAFFRQQEAVARELVAVSAYVPRLTKAEQGLAPAGKRMRAEIGKSKTPDAQAAALRTYAAALTRVAAALDAIRAPALFAPSHEAQIRQLRASAAKIRRLATALAAGDAGAVKRAIAALGRVSGDGGQKAARKAVADYNGRVERIGKLAVALEKERVRLSKDLG
jgi:hypothetical protein